MPRYHWRAEGCPPGPPDIVDKLEAALAKDFPEVEISVLGKAYAIRLKPQPFRHRAQKRPHEEPTCFSRGGAGALGRPARGAASPTRARAVEYADPAPPAAPAVARTRLRRHGILLLVVVTSLWMATVAVSRRARRRTVLLVVYVNSFAFWGCFLQAALSSTGSRLALCNRERDERVLAPRIAFFNLIFACVACVLAGGIALEYSGDPWRPPICPPPIGQLDGARRRWCGGFASPKCRHSGQVARVRIATKADGRLPRGAEEAARCQAARHSARRSAVDARAATTSSGAGPQRPEATKRRRRHRRCRTMAVAFAWTHASSADDRSYLMYHGTRPEAALEIERYGFCRAKDGMLGEGVYLSRDVTKASYCPLRRPSK